VPLITDTEAEMAEKQDLGGSNAKRAQTLKNIRATLGRTQAELANALGVSVKAVQSYEQGWRTVPTRVLIQLVVLLALYRKHNMDDVPCWEIRHCPREMRDTCSAFTIGKGQFCWFVGNKDCRPPAVTEVGDALPCMSCPVIQRLLKGPSNYTQPQDGSPAAS